MTAAMMLPSSLGFIRYYAATAGRAPDFPLTIGLFLSAYFAVWTAFALVAFTGDMELHRIVDVLPWLAKHATLIPAATLALAAVYQFTPLKDACLKACRHPGDVSRAQLSPRHTQWAPARFRPRTLLSWLLLGAHARDVCGRGRAFGVDGHPGRDYV